MAPTPEQMTSFVINLRQAITALGEALPDAERYLVENVGEHLGNPTFAYAFRLTACPLMDEFLKVADFLAPGGPSWPNASVRSSMSHLRTFIDDWPLPDSVALTKLLSHVDWCFYNLMTPPPLPADGRVLDERAEAAVARYLTWRPTHDHMLRAEGERIRSAMEANAAGLPDFKGRSETDDRSHK